MKLGILGYPVAHSLSPRMQTAALRAVGLLDWTYEAIEVTPAQLAEALAVLRGPPWRGANITLPHKEAAARACDRLSDEASAIAAVNTIVVEDGRLHGHNTDIEAIRACVAEAARDRICAVLGAGGAARAAVAALRAAGAAEIRVLSRRAAALPGATRACGWSAAALADCAVVVGCTPPDAAPPPLGALAPDARVLDLVYYGPSALATLARAHGFSVEDGRGVLLHQGARAFELWTGRPAPTTVMWEALGGGPDGGAYKS